MFAWLFVSPPIPTLPTRYRCDAFIGEGATGEVFKAHDTILGVDVAFKIVRKNLAMHRRFRARFSREVAISAQVAHRHLVPVHDTGILASNQPFVALAYADRGNLMDLLRQGCRLGELLRLSEQVCRALSALHARGLVHQDLKPENVLLHAEPDGRTGAWVADLGVADELGALARDARRVGGTPAFMAPEQLEGRPQEFGPWTDLYALGLMLYEALSGVRPHIAAGRRELLRLRLGPPPPLAVGDDVPQGLVDLIHNLLDPEPRQRYDRAADVRRMMADARKELEADDPELQLRRGGGAHTELESTDPVALAVLGAKHGRNASLRWNRVPPKRMPEEPTSWNPPNLASASLPLLALREMPLLGRDAEIQRIWTEARHVVSDRAPSVILVVGPRGSGRSALVHSVARTLDEGGWMEVVPLRYRDPPGIDDGYPGAVREILAPWNDDRRALQARLTRWFARDREDTLVAATHQAVQMARWSGYLYPGEQPPNTALGLNFLYQHLERRAWRGGSCVVMDDVNHAEEPGDGLAMAEALLDETVGRRPVLVLATLSAESLRDDPELAERVEMLQERGALRIDLAPPGTDLIDRILSETLFLDPGLAEEIARRIDGHPLQATLLLRDWAARGALESDETGRFRLKAGNDLRKLLPSDLESLFRMRLQSAVDATGHPEEAAAALAAVSLAGQAPPIEVLREVSEIGVEELLATGLLRQDSGVLRFEQGGLERTARALAQELPNAHEIHMLLADAWRQLGERTGADVDLPLGMHLLEAGHSAEAVGSLLRSVRGMLDQGRLNVARRAADLAIRAADHSWSPDNEALPVRMEARRLKGIALLELDDPEGALKEALSAADLGWGERLTRTRLTVLRARAEMELNRGPRARSLLTGAHQSFWAMRDKEGLAEIALYRGHLARTDNRLHEALEQYNEVLRQRPIEARVCVAAMQGLVHVYLHLGTTEEAAPIVQQLAESARQTGDTRTEAEASFAAGNVRLQQGRLDEAHRLFLRAQAKAAASGDMRMLVNAVNYLGEVARHQGDVVEARRLYTRYVRLARGRHWDLAEAVGRINLALIDLGVRDMARADLHASRAAQVMARQPRSWIWVYVGVIRSACAAWSADEAKTRQWWQLALERGARTHRSGDLWGPVQALHEACETHGWSDLENDALELLAIIRRA
ncbi:MAG: protein kinase [Proteobacteria bacterium]|nr:protein kinase [Pseudomonadota bacterium]MCP4915313.1 protein kinase [Pseudomonadota bacterium]